MGEIHPSGITGGASDLLSGLRPSDYLAIARRRKWWIILSTLGLSVCTAVIARRMPPIYRAETVILVNSAQVPDKYIPSINTGDIAGRLTTLEQQVLSPTRLKKLVEAEGLFPDPTGKKTEEQVVGAVQKSITVEVVNPGGGKMGAFRIAYSSRERTEVARIANLLAQMFIEENLRARVDQTEDTAQFLQDQLQETKRQLDEKDAELRAIKSHNILDLPESKPYHMEALANLRSQALAIQDKIQQDERESNVLQTMLLSGTDAPTVDVSESTENGAGPYQNQLQRLESHLAELRTRYGPGHPEVHRTQNEIERLKAKIAAEVKDTPETKPIDKPALDVPKKRRNPVLEAQIEQLKEDIRNQTSLLQPLQAQMAFHESKLQTAPAFEQQISHLQQEYDALKGLYGSLQDKEQSAKLSHALEVREKGEKFEVLDAAITPDGPAAPNRLLISFSGLFGGLLAGCVLAAAAELNDESVRTETEAAQICRKPILAGVPLIVSIEEQRSRLWRAMGMLTGVVFGSAAFGFLLSILSGRFF